MALAHTVVEDVLPVAERMPTYAGAYQDHRNGGRVVIMLTRHDAVAEASLRSLARIDSPGIDFGVARHTSTELTDAAEAARDVWMSVTDLPLRGIGIDYRNNAVRLGVESHNMDAAATLAPSVSEKLGVVVSLVEVDPGSAEIAACDDRDHCAYPFRLGVRIHANSETGPRCTMGFHIKLGTDYQYLTAGHCPVLTGAAAWYHQGITGTGFIGNETQNNEYRLQPAVDLVAMQMADQHANFRIYGINRYVKGRTDPLQDEILCASLGRSDAIDCGNVVDPTWSYIDSEGTGVVQAFDLDGVVIQGGDSGSPVYRALSGTDAYAIGSISTLGGYASKLGAALTAWGAGVVIEP
jgi:hypothetical protein